MADESLTFSSVLKEQQTLLIRSNLSNLANAHVMLGEEALRLQKEVIVLHGLQAEIETMGERDPASLHIDEVRELYDRAMNHKNGRRR